MHPPPEKEQILTNRLHFIYTHCYDLKILGTPTKSTVNLLSEAINENNY